MLLYILGSPAADALTIVKQEVRALRDAHWVIELDFQQDCFIAITYNIQYQITKYTSTQDTLLAYSFHHIVVFSFWSVLLCNCCKGNAEGSLCQDFHLITALHLSS